MKSSKKALTFIGIFLTIKSFQNQFKTGFEIHFLILKSNIMSTLVSTWVDTPINLEDSINDPSWNDAGIMNTPKGKVMVKNNS